MPSEADYTSRSSWCPHPEYWNARDAQATEDEVLELVAGMVRAIQPDYVIETGTWLGFGAAMIGNALAQNGHGHLDTFEVEPDRVEQARGRVRGLPVDVHHMSSLEFVPDRKVGFLWLDSFTDLRVPEYHHFRPWMQPGTIVGFHDTAPHHGTWSDELLSLSGTRAIQFRTPRGVTFLEVVT
jgi:predicted O-methyltransferase YrrM